MVVKHMQKIWKSNISREVVATVAAHSNSVSVGLCQGFSAVLIPQLMAKNSSIPITEDDASWMAALGVISNPLGALLAGILMEIFGRKATIKLTSLPYFVGWVLIACASGIPMMYAGRFITGLAVGMATASYVYVAEVSLPQHRGTLSAAGPIHVSLGVLAVYVLGFVAHWQLVAALCTICSVTSFLAICSVPESAPWLAGRGRVAEASRALRWFRESPAQADAELADLLRTVAGEKNSNSSDVGQSGSALNGAVSYLKPFFKPSAWKPFLILMVFFLFQEGSGIYVFLYYAVSVFQDAGSGLNEFVSSIVVGVLRLVMSVVGTVLIKNFGRKTLAVASGLGMTLAMIAGGFYEYQYSHLPTTERPLLWIPLVCVLVHVCVSMVGFLQLPWIMNGELFPLNIRGVMGGVVAALANLFIFASVKTYPSMTHSLGMDGTLWLFAASSLFGAVFCQIFLPETRGRTLREIEMAFHGRTGDKTKGEVRPPADIYTIEDQILTLRTISPLPASGEAEGPAASRRRADTVAGDDAASSSRL
ncbi:facilitated trehalose transporter Tret1-2 homolog [Bacillus rossius redtenbacheri]|uniref:facilitated trehalose transporter Tret1-2 homolog n=1 Tax=Bacillus rossius redtenbacheri TaxID=93214 RepID=UPI002FDD052A